MAKYSSIAVGKAKGSAGSITFSSAFGIKYFKEKAINVSNPNSPQQKGQRGRMRYLVGLFQAFAIAINIGFRKTAVKMSPYNKFISTNMNNGAVTNVLDVVTLDMSKLSLSQGQMAPTAIEPTSSSIEGDLTTIKWDGVTVPVNGSATDSAVVAVSCNAKRIAAISALATARTAGSVSFSATDFPVESGDIVDCYLFFLNEGTGNVCGSTYIQLTTTS